MTADERELYTAVETYIAGTWNQATATERSAVGFVMTIYRRRLATVTIRETIPYEAPCLCLGPKGGGAVAEEYLEARFRLYRMVYMHKTTRAAERMLEKLLKAVAEAGDGRLSRDDPVLRYLTSETPQSALTWVSMTPQCGHRCTCIKIIRTRI